METKKPEAADHPDTGDLQQHLIIVRAVCVNHNIISISSSIHIPNWIFGESGCTNYQAFGDCRPTLRPRRSMSRLERMVAAMLTMPKITVEACGEGEPEATKMETE